MGKKRFIDKKNSQKFHLLHRSQTDAAYAQEGIPSEFVLVPVSENGDVLFQSSENTSEKLSLVDFKEKKDHINELGFVNDGYDYGKHMKEMGGGKFISKDGTVRETIVTYKSNIEIPNDVLPSQEELQRDYEAITISHELMDSDLRAALFEGFDNEGEFEALDDDFVLQAMTEPEKPDFDFDQHIANLIARSEQMLGINKPRGWDGEDAKHLRKKVAYEDDEDEIESWVDEEEDDSRINVPQRSKVLGRTDFTEDDLDKILEDYDEDQIGELDEVDEKELQGYIDEENEMVQAALEDFLQNEIDSKYAAGIELKKGNRASVRQNDEESEQPVDIHTAFQQQLQIQQQSEEQLKMLDFEQETLEDMLQTQEYLNQEKVYEEWDCETIISTYSTLDNHPRLIRDPKTKFQPFHLLKKASRHRNNVNDEESVTVSVTSSAHQRLKSVPLTQPSNPPSSINGKGKIILSGKLNLPEGFSKYSQPKTKTKGRAGLSAIEEEQKNEQFEEKSHFEDNEDSEKEGEDSGKESDAEGKKGKNKETREEKKLRKQAVKEERKQKRMNKKLLKSAFQKEGVKIIKELGKEDSTNHCSVFKYSV